MTEEKKEMQYHSGFYVGKEFRRNFDMKKDGVALLDEKGVKQVGKIFGIKLKETMDQLYGKSFTIFSTTKGFDEVTEGDWVKLGYVEEQFVNKKGQDSKSNKVLWISKADKEEVVAEKKETTSVFKVGEDFNDFKENYLLLCEKEKKEPSAVHMMGCYLATYYEPIVKDLYKKCQESVKK